jgi:hypothetical protein
MARYGVTISLEYLIKQPNKLPMLINRKFVFSCLKYRIINEKLVRFTQKNYCASLFLDCEIHVKYITPQFILFISPSIISYKNIKTSENILYGGTLYYRSCRPKTFEWFSNFINSLKTTDKFVIIKLLVEECLLAL